MEFTAQANAKQLILTNLDIVVEEHAVQFLDRARQLHQIWADIVVEHVFTLTVFILIIVAKTTAPPHAKQIIPIEPDTAKMEHALMAKVIAKQQTQINLVIAKPMQLAQTAKEYVRQQILTNLVFVAQIQHARAERLRAKQIFQTNQDIVKMEHAMVMAIARQIILINQDIVQVMRCVIMEQSKAEECINTIHNGHLAEAPPELLCLIILASPHLLLLAKQLTQL